MKKSILSLIVLASIASIAVAGSYSIIRLPTPGAWEANITGVGKAVHIEVYDSAIADGTVAIYTRVPGSSTSNLACTVTCANGKVVQAIASTNAFYLAGGDVLYRTGTATNGTVRIILE